MTLARGPRQLVVQLALLTILQLLSSTSSLTPSTTVASSSSLAGTVRITRGAPAWRWRSICARLRNTPVASITKSTPSSFQGSSAGSRVEKSLVVWSPTLKVSPSQATSMPSRPMTVSYLSR